MRNITGNPVIDKDFLRTRLFLVENLKELIKNCSVIIEAPRRFGKTSVIKEFMRQEEFKKKKEREFNVLFFELEGEKNINDFCLKLFKELLSLYRLRNRINRINKSLGDGWNILASRIKKIKGPEIEFEIREKTKNYSFSKWKEKISPLITDLNSFNKRTIIVFDEFPDMLMNFKKSKIEGLSFKDTIDNLTAWLRSLRQTQRDGCKYQFIFCGSIHLRKTMEQMGISKRINDLEPFVIPPIKSDDARLLIESLAEKYELEIEPDGVTYMVSKITAGSLYYGQTVVKALIDTEEKNFSIGKVKTIYKAMLQGGNHDFYHFYSRLEAHLSPLEKECAELILKHLCLKATSEEEIYDLFLYKKCTYEKFQSIVNRLIYEGYITRDITDNGNLRFVAYILKDWWSCKTGVKDVRL